MTKKRFYLDENGINDREYEFSILGEDELVDRINELNDENRGLNKKNKQLSIGFMGFKMKLIEQLHIHYDYASEQRQKYIYCPFIVKAYDIIRYDIRKLAEEMGVDLE